MNVLVIAPPHETVPPFGYGGTESVVELLIRHLGSDPSLTLLLACAAGSKIMHPAVRLVEHDVPALRTLEATTEEKRALGRRYLTIAFQQGLEYNVALIHNHAGEAAMEKRPESIPMLTTLHCFPPAESLATWKSYHGFWNSISRREREVVGSPGGTHVGTVLNGIDVPSFPFGSAKEKEPYLLFIGRFSPEKGAHVALRVAQRLGLRILLAAKTPDNPDDEKYFRDTIEPMLRAYPKAEYVGEVGPDEKRELYRKATATLSPILWEEPFGLILAESLACGTPVVTFPRGAAPEIVSHGVTGYLPCDEEEMVAAVRAIEKIDPVACRNDAEQRFSGDIMAENYRRLYEELSTDCRMPTALATPG